MLLPFATDAPIYHLPIATVALILVNAAVFFSTAELGIAISPENVELEAYMLQFNGLHPVQWLTNNFMHVNIIHLLGNMFFLWLYGLIIEGKLGWWRFLFVYLVICVVYGAAVQTVMVVVSSGNGAALGASGALFGLLGIATLWAPDNEVSCLLVLGFWIRVVELAVWTFAFIYFGLQLLEVVLTGMAMSSAMLHLTGLAVGVPAGLLMLRKGWVDCEGCDLFSRWFDRPLEKKTPKKVESRGKVETIDPKRQKRRLAAAIGEALEAGNDVIALRLYRQYANQLQFGRQLDSDQLLRIINGLLKAKDWDNVCQPIVALLESCTPQQAIPLRLKLARIVILRLNRPKQGLKILSKLPSQLPAGAAADRQALEQRARAQVQDGVIEFDIEDW